MKISIIGTGNMGMGLAKQLSKAGYEVFLGSRNSEKAREKALTLSEEVKSGTNEEAARFGDIIIPAIKFPLVLDVVKRFESLNDKIIVDISNPVGIKLDHDTSAAEELAKIIPNTKLVKAFNTIFSSLLDTNPQFGDQKANLFICGNDEESKKIISEIGVKLGYEPIDVGSLKIARYLESLTLFEIHLGQHLNQWNIAFKLLIR